MEVTGGKLRGERSEERKKGFYRWRVEAVGRGSGVVRAVG